MIRSLARLIHVAVLGPDPERDPVNGSEAWVLFQNKASALKEKARQKHSAVKPIEKRQQDIVHSALARSIPSRGVEA